ncbi:uncharacterized protein LOC132195806 [Neocloeon triangulifer]|uniref:uncharacterized protein LOC132195806 n=1 Tax=Neocloeon triangulifer TaxID=2078957 RepID=UPI00286F44A1|nr:uncharacterized protein LOC132195806 [Neocloeon triangulifer]
MACDAWISIKILLFVMSVVCMLVKKVTDYDASRLFFLLEKLSYEWPLLTNVTWDEHGAAFVDITFGGFIVITAGLVVAAAAGELKRKNSMETFFLFVGALMFGAAGALVLASIDQIPHQLIGNAAGLGVIALITALLFLVDLLLASRRRKRARPLPKASTASQTYPQHPPAPLFAAHAPQKPLYRVTSMDGPMEQQTRPKWLESGQDEWGPPPGATNGGRGGFVMRTAQGWPKNGPVGGGGYGGGGRGLDTADAGDSEVEFEPTAHLEVTTEGPKAQVINTHVLHKWLRRQRHQQDHPAV